MNTNHSPLKWTLLLLLATLNAPLSTAFAQGTAFTYHGRLTDGGSPANGSYDLTFAVFANSSGPPQVGSTLTNVATGVTNGLFIVILDFGANFPGADRFLEIGARTNGPGSFATLTPRQKLTAVPYAITAGNLTGTVTATGLSGTYSSAVTLNNTANSFSGSGAGLTALNADNISSGTLVDTHLSGNVALRAGGNDFTGNQTVTGGNVGIGVIPTNRLHVSGGATFTGTALVGGNLAIGTTAPEGPLHVTEGSAGSVTASVSSIAVFERSGSAYLSMLTPTNNSSGIFFGTPNSATDGGISYNTSTPRGLAFRANGNSTKMVIEADGNVGIGTTSPSTPLHVVGGSDAGLTGGGFVMAGSAAGQNLVLDDNEIMSRTNGGISQLVLNKNGGKVGIGTASPSTALHVVGGTDASVSGGGYIVAGAVNGLNVVIDNNEIMARNNFEPAPLYLNADGGFDSGVKVGSGGLDPAEDNVATCGSLNNAWWFVLSYNYYTASDARLKDNIQSLSYGLQTVLSLRPVSYDWKKNPRRESEANRSTLGLIAQEVEPVVPEAVIKDENPDHHMAVNYDSFIPILIKAVQEQQSLIDTQRAENVELKRRLDLLERFVTHQAGGRK